MDADISTLKKGWRIVSDEALLSESPCTLGMFRQYGMFVHRYDERHFMYSIAPTRENVINNRTFLYQLNEICVNFNKYYVGCLFQLSGNLTIFITWQPRLTS